MTKEGEQLIAENLNEIAEALKTYAAIIALKTIVDNAADSSEAWQVAIDKLFKYGKNQL